MKKKLDRLAGAFVGEDFQPLSVVENSGFQRFVHGLNPRYEIPSRKRLTNKVLPSLYFEAKENLSTLLSKTTAVSITTDTWTSISNDSFLAITCHFFVDEDPETLSTPPKLHSAALAVKLITQDEKAETLCELITECLREWSIYEKTTAIVTDNAANMKAAVALMPEAIKHYPCFAHSLNLVLKNSIQNCSSRVVKEVIAKAKALVTFFHHSPKAERILERENEQLLEEGQRKPIKLVQYVSTHGFD